VGVWGSIGELGAHYMCEVRFGSVLRFQLGVQKGTLLPITKMYVCMYVCMYVVYLLIIGSSPTCRRARTVQDCGRAATPG
jgi:hypothetical protein